MHFFWVGHFWIIFSKKKFFFCFFLMKISQSLLVSKDQAKHDNTFWPMPNILTGSVLIRPILGQKIISNKQISRWTKNMYNGKVLHRLWIAFFNNNNKKVIVNCWLVAKSETGTEFLWFFLIFWHLMLNVNIELGNLEAKTTCV